MLRFLVRRLGTMLLALWLVATVTFIMMHSVPGGPFASEKQVPPAVLKNLNARYHLDDPLWKQYADYLINLAQGDFGPSFKLDRTVNEIIAEAFPVSATLGFVAVTFAVIVGLFLGVVSALRQNRWPDYIAMALATFNFSVPSFILSGLLMYVFAFKLRLLPPAMWGSWQQVVLPALALSALPTAFIARLMRSSMLEVLQQDYIKTARAKGLSERVIVMRHAVRNAIMPVVTYLGPLIAAVLTGSFVIEHIFAIPGLGKYFVNSVLGRDYTMIMGTTIFYSAFLMLMNLIVDLVYTLIDPRIKLADVKEV
ncbi:ABC transporter permease [Desulforudis sp. 1088]|uniref:ABC transporter permease n=1 Tax=unclassified Candidatus Desulforudis TaxID=2635950 RepID=UPI00347BB051